MNTYDDTPLTFLGTLYTFAYSKVHAGVFNRLGFPVGLFIAVSGPGDGSCHIVYAVGNIKSQVCNACFSMQSRKIYSTCSWAIVCYFNSSQFCLPKKINVVFPKNQH